jgi:aspartyl/asparaginyl beta-hydroxylase (cupin superfamily)
MEDLEGWLAKIRAGNAAFREQTGAARLGALDAAAHLLAAPRLLKRLLRRTPADRPDLQLPWLPLWPGLAATPLHDPRDHPWTHAVRAACPDIKRELAAVRSSFERARYDSHHNPKPWNTFYFFLEGRPVPDHLAACPRTADLLRCVPHNAFHVCFSAIEPGGSLHPHTGPTNASLTAHLGLVDCAGSRLCVAGRTVDYCDDETLVFDDSFVHWVENVGTRVRYTLMITFWHPELSRLERAFLRQVIRSGARR